MNVLVSISQFQQIKATFFFHRLIPNTRLDDYLIYSLVIVNQFHYDLLY